jgi:long-chain fatty acid transport protein
LRVNLVADEVSGRVQTGEIAMRASGVLGRVALCGLLGASLVSVAEAGGFAVREQSVEYQGMSFAGNAAGGGGLSGMFWNPAVLGEFEGFQTDSNYSIIAPYAKISGSNSAGGTTPSGNAGKLALVPASYVSYQLTDDLVAGVSMNAPFGLANKTDYNWAGQTFNRASAVTTYNGQAAIAYNLSPELTIGGGLLVEYMKADLRSASGIAANAPSIYVQGEDFGFGFSGGVTWRPVEGTHIGAGFRSAIKHKLEGDIFVAAAPVMAPVFADVTLPEIATLSVRQDISETTRLLATAEWTNWSRLKSLDVICETGIGLCGAPGPGGTVNSLKLGWHDGYFFSAGLEHDFNDALTLRGGIAYEISPIRAADERTMRVPDSDRVWLSLGASYQITEKTKANLAYSHVFMEKGAINRTESGLTFTGTSKSHLDIISAGMSVDF